MADPDPDQRPPARRWIKGVGIALIVAVWLPVIVCAGELGLASLSVRRAQAAAENARAAVRTGATLSEAVLTSADAVGRARFLQCYEATCVDRPERVLASRRVGTFSAMGPDASLASSQTVEDWRRQLAHLDRDGCKRVKITFCGRPWITFLVEMGGDRRVSKVSPLSVSTD